MAKPNDTALLRVALTMLFFALWGFVFFFGLTGLE